MSGIPIRHLRTACLVGLAVVVIMILAVFGWGIHQAGIAENHLQNVYQVAQAVRTYSAQHGQLPERWHDLQGTGMLRHRAGWVDAEASVTIRWPFDRSGILSSRASTADVISSDYPCYPIDGIVSGLDQELRVLVQAGSVHSR